MDLRVLTKSGQKDIAKEIVDTSTIIDAIKQISTTDRANIFSFFKEVSKQYKVLNGVREEVANSPELQAFLSSSTTTEAQRKEAMALITLAVMKNLGYKPNDIKSIYTDERGYNDEKIKGFTSLQTGASYINFKNITNMKDLVKTITHENQRSMDIQDHRDINKNRDDDTKYASNFSDFATRYFSHALWLNDKGFSKTPLTTAVTSSIVNNNREFAKLDKNLGVNRVEAYSREVFLGKNHMFIVVNGSNYKEGITIASLGAKDFVFGGDTEIVVKDINHISKEEKTAHTDRDHYLNNTWEEKQVIETPRGMTEREFDERVLENARNYNKIFEDNRYPNLASTISESFFGGYNNNEDSLLRNSNTFVDDVIEFSGGSIMNFKNAPLQNSTELRNLTEQLNKIAPHTIDFGVLMQ